MTVRRLVCLALLLCAAGCRSSESQDHLVTVWAMGREGEVIGQLLSQFRRLHPEIEVRIQQLPFKAAHQKLLTAVAGGATPDVCQLGNTWVPEFAALKALEPLGPSTAQSTIVQESDYFPGIWDTNVIAGTLYGVPWYVDTRLLFYRRDLLAKAGFSTPPKTWEEWSRMLAGIKALVGTERYSVFLPLNEFEPLLVLALQQPERLLRESDRFGNFRNPGFRRTLAFYVEMFRRGWAPPVSNTQIPNAWNELGRGYYSFYISGPWSIGEFTRRLPPEQQSTWTTASMPGPEGPGASIAGGSSLVIFRNSRHKADAWRLLEYLSTVEVQRQFYELTGDLPPRRTSWQDPRLAANPYTRAFREQLERAKPAPKVPEWERIMTEMRLVAERAVQGEISVDQAAQELDQTVDGILEKRRWLASRGVAP
jgi:multiple sugar transport system substrate-binding protein